MPPWTVVSSVAPLAHSVTARGQRWRPIPNVRVLFPIYVREALLSVAPDAA